jgi:peptidoglycan/LPS O-acetylase OafA/YrhL
MKATTGTDLGGRLTALEGLRTFAVLAVVATHAGFLCGTTGGHVLPGLVSRLDFGVAIFFVLSGFLLHLPHARVASGEGRAPTTRDYFLRRTARILPAFVVCVAATWALVPEARRAPTTNWLATTFLIQTLNVDWHIPALNHLWSLSTEAAFYLALPLLVAVLRLLGRGRRPLTSQAVLLLALTLLVWVYRALVSQGFAGLPLAALVWLPGYLDWFAAGMLIAIVRIGAPRVGWARSVAELARSVPVAARLLGAVLIWLATTRLAGPYDLSPATVSEDLAKHLLYLAAAALVVAPAALGATDAVTRFLSNRVMVWCGTVSYGVFLWHLPLMYAVRSALGLQLFGGHFWLTLLATLAVTVPVSALSWYLLEHPVLRWVHERTRRAPDPVPAPQVAAAAS